MAQSCKSTIENTRRVKEVEPGLIAWVWDGQGAGQDVEAIINAENYASARAAEFGLINRPGLAIEPESLPGADRADRDEVKNLTGFFQFLGWSLFVFILWVMLCLII